MLIHYPSYFLTYVLILGMYIVYRYRYQCQYSLLVPILIGALFDIIMCSLVQIKMCNHVKRLNSFFMTTRGGNTSNIMKQISAGNRPFNPKSCQPSLQCKVLSTNLQHTSVPNNHLGKSNTLVI